VRVWIVVNECRGLAEAKVYRSYRDAENAKRRQIRSYRRVLARSTDEDMGNGFKGMLRDWIRQTNIIGIEV